MPLHLDEMDISIIKSLLYDGRKSFRQISRDTGISTPTVKARFERLVDVGFIKGVVPFFDFNKVNNIDEDLIQIQNISEISSKNHNTIYEKEIDEIKKRITIGLAINLVCDYCQGPILGKPKVLKFANIERFFCCNSCKTVYNDKYKGRIESLKRKYENK
jgi:DNA-binding Lrp family transcriptional regulator